MEKQVLNRRKDVELFEAIRREYQFGVGTVKGVVRKFGVHPEAQLHRIAI
ncbi:MAG: hypothetical protein ABSG03_26075 [Bryobacteraceae bacterium]|jgi:hypothetical protein